MSKPAERSFLANYLDPSACRTPIIYFLLKFHKDATRPPERPIVNGIESVSACLGQYIDYFLKLIISKTKAYLGDTKQFIQILEQVPCRSNSILITADVNSLYTIINLSDAILSVKWALLKSDLTSRYRITLLQCLEFCLTKNDFWYNINFCLQIMDVAMGARFAPSVANLFMALWEEESIFQERPSQLKCYKRYIDDLIMIWEGETVSLEAFMLKLNNNTKNISL